MARLHRASAATLRARAEATAVQAKVDAAAAARAEESEVCMVIVAQRAADLQNRIDVDTRQRNERNVIASKLMQAETNAYDMQDRIAKAREWTDDCLRTGDVTGAAAHGNAIGSL